MIDHNGRKIDYLRISVTDRCNLRCKYCMPDGIRSVPMSQILTFEEILAIVRETAAIGIRCVRLTGGEPLVRLGMPDLVRKLKRVPGIEKVTMTTNGILLQENLPALTGAGLDAVNISLDTMDRAQYRAITGTDGLDKIKSDVQRIILRNAKNIRSDDFMDFTSLKELELYQCTDGTRQYEKADEDRFEFYNDDVIFTIS